MKRSRVILPYDDELVTPIDMNEIDTHEGCVAVMTRIRKTLILSKESYSQVEKCLKHRYRVNETRELCVATLIRMRIMNRTLARDHSDFVVAMCAQFWGVDRIDLLMCASHFGAYCGTPGVVSILNFVMDHGLPTLTDELMQVWWKLRVFRCDDEFGEPRLSFMVRVKVYAMGQTDSEFGPRLRSLFEFPENRDQEFVTPKKRIL